MYIDVVILDVLLTVWRRRECHIGVFVRRVSGWDVLDWTRSKTGGRMCNFKGTICDCRCCIWVLHQTICCIYLSHCDNGKDTLQPLLSLGLVTPASSTTLNETGSIIQLDRVRDWLGCITEQMTLKLLYIIWQSALISMVSFICRLTRVVYVVKIFALWRWWFLKWLPRFFWLALFAGATEAATCNLCSGGTYSTASGVIFYLTFYAHA